MTAESSSQEKNLTNALISALALLPDIPTQEQVEEKAQSLAALFGYDGDLRNVIGEAMISVVTRMGAGVSLGGVDELVDAARGD